MSAATTHCDRIITMIDDCLADYEASTATVRAQPMAALAPGATWWRFVPTGHPLGAR
jgi:hypothetical protein